MTASTRPQLIPSRKMRKTATRRARVNQTLMILIDAVDFLSDRFIRSTQRSRWAARRRGRQPQIGLRSTKVFAALVPLAPPQIVRSHLPEQNPAAGPGQERGELELPPLLNRQPHVAHGAIKLVLCKDLFVRDGLALDADRVPVSFDLVAGNRNHRSN